MASSNGRPASTSGDHPTPGGLRLLGEREAIPGGFLVAFAGGLLDRLDQLTGQGRPPAAARRQVTSEALGRFHASQAERAWTVPDRRVTQLARQLLGIQRVLRQEASYPPDRVRSEAIGELLAAERARVPLPLPDWLWRHRLDPIRRAQRHAQWPAADRRPSTRTREADGER